MCCTLPRFLVHSGTSVNVKWMNEYPYLWTTHSRHLRVGRTSTWGFLPWTYGDSYSKNGQKCLTHLTLTSCEQEHLYRYSLKIECSSPYRWRNCWFLCICSFPQGPVVYVCFLTQYSRVGIPFGQNFHGIAILFFSEVRLYSVVFTFMFYFF